MYSKRVDAFDEDDFNAGMLLAAQGAVTLAESQATEQWQNAALNRTIIGQAEGILMERFTLTADQAFSVLPKQHEAVPGGWATGADTRNPSSSHARLSDVFARPVAAKPLTSALSLMLGRPVGGE
jgi:hypothetical protein